MSVAALQNSTGMLLSDLLHGFAAAPALAIDGIASDSRDLAAGYLFLALPGESGHGLDYAEAAFKSGAAAIAYDKDSADSVPQFAGLPLIAVEHLAARAGEIANRFYATPSRALRVVGVTGTNGKTTVASLIRQCMSHLDRRCAYSGTLGYGLDSLHDSGGMTSPAAVELHRRLAGFVDAGASYAAIEVSSHALSQSRVDGVDFAAAIFTNLTRDHLDYHGDMRRYFETKARLFVGSGARDKIINVDCEYGRELASRCGNDVVAVAVESAVAATQQRFVKVESITADGSGSTLTISSSWGGGTIALPLVGAFNVENAALVLAYLLTDGIDIEQACDVLQLVEPPPGRLQPVAGTKVFVDYAHTPDAIRSALSALRPHCEGELWCVFGCGGDRDVGKRALMAQAARAHADRIVVTTDNPRSEAPAEIIGDILAGIELSASVTAIEDRAAAIAWTVMNAGADDVVLLAGKGHENYQEIDGERRPFSDIAVATLAGVEDARS